MLPDIPWWAWGLLYASGGAVTGWWHLREYRRNRVYRSRIADAEDVAAALGSSVFLPGLFRAVLHLGAVVAWPLVALAVLIGDVPGYGKNLTDDERAEAGRS